jgi:hypothetical protein
MVISVGAAAFWIALAAVIISGRWYKLRREALKHETIRHMIEKTGRIDEAQLKELFPAPPPPGPLPPHWFQPPEQGVGYRTMRVFGTLALFVALGLAICFSILYRFGDPSWRLDAPNGFGVASVVALLGVGLFVASRFVKKPLPQGDGD